MKKEKLFTFSMQCHNDEGKTTDVIFATYKSEAEAVARLKTEYFVQRARYESQGDAITESCLRPELMRGWFSTENGYHMDMFVAAF